MMLGAPTTPHEWLIGGGEMGALIRAKDWSTTPLGPRECWPQSLRTTVNLVLENRFPMALLWGTELLLLYNDDYRIIAKDKHPMALGRSTREIWAEVCHINEPILAAVMERGETLYFENKLFRVNRSGTLEDALFTLCYSPVRREDGTIGGTLVILEETTGRHFERELIEALRLENIGIWEWDLKTNEMRWSHQLYSIFRVTPDSFTPSVAAFRSFLHPREQEQVEKTIREAICVGSPVELEYQMMTPDGSIRTMLSKVTITRRDPDGTPQVMLGIERDITERKQAEENLRRRSEELAAVLDAVPAFVWFGLDPQCQMITGNLAAREILGVSLGSNVSQSVVAIREASSVRQLQADGTEYHVDELPMQKAIATKQSVRDAYITFVAPNGRRIETVGNAVPLFGTDGEVRGAVAAFFDVTEQRSVERALRESELKYRSLFVNMVEEVHLWRLVRDEAGNIKTWRLVDINPAALKGWGKTRDEVLEKEVDEIFPGATEHFMPIVTKIFAEDAPYSWETYFPPLGQYLRMTSSPFDGHFITTGADVTAIRKAQMALEDANMQLHEADRRKNEFLGILSHELRNPLAPIRNSLHILDHAVPGSEQAHRALAMIERQVVHLSRLVDDLLDVTRITRGKIVLQRERLDLCELVRSTAEDHLGAFAEAEIELTVSTGPSTIWVNGDRTRLSQVVANLLMNAAKFTPSGGKTILTVETDPMHRAAIIRIQDTGRGISPTLLPRLFEAFTQADNTLDRTLGGLGLGLSLVKGLVEMHGGTVSAESEGVGKGATFTIRLPIDTTAAVEVPTEATEPTVRPCRVLVIEDNVDAANSLCEVLRMDGHEVDVAFTGTEGLTKAQNFKPDVILCDIGLPEMNGYEVARAIRADAGLAHTKLVALTGYARPDDVAKAKEAGFDSHLAKPPSLTSLKKLLCKENG